MGDVLDKQENLFTVLAGSNFTRFRHLRDLKLVKCGVEEIRPDTFQTIQTLRTIDLRFNHIEKVNEEMFRGAPQLEFIDLSNNPIHHVSDFAFRSLAMDNLMFGNNPALTSISAKAFVGASIGSLTLNRCNLAEIDAETFSYLKESLRTLSITHNMQPLLLSDGSLKGLKLELLDLTDNGLLNTDYLEDVTSDIVDLDDNPLEEFDCDDCDDLRSTRVLSIMNANIKHITRENFAQLVSLVELDLENNDLTVFNATVFERNKVLETIDLSFNDISDFEGDFKTVLPGIDDIFLHGNDIETLPHHLEPLFNRLDNLTLQDNPLHCNCEVRWFVKWLEKNRDILQDIDSVTCGTPEARNITTISDYGFQCRAPTIFNATFDTDGISLLCTAEGDPPPDVSWVSSADSKQKMTLASRWDRHTTFQTQNSLTITKDGNFTCIATNIAGEDRITVNTRQIPKAGMKFVIESQQIELLETPQGMMFVLFFVALLGYYFRWDSLKQLQTDSTKKRI